MPPELFDLAEKVAVVTGGARGLGKAAAQGLAAHGAEVAVLDILVDEMMQCQAEIQRSGKRCETYPCDVSDEEQVRATAEQVLSDFSRIDILVNIAGITKRVATTEITSAAVRRLTEVNYFGTFWCCREFGKLMLRQGQGNIINMSALGGGLLGTGRGNAAYSSTKGAIAALTKELAAEWGSQGIRVNALAPCWFQTEMNANSIFATPTFLDQVYSKLPMRRIGQPADVVGPIVFLASEASRMITGLILPVDGGAAATCPITLPEND
jgi:gluconate 5-dehydrogenase